ncbi:MAG: S8 family peptidase, partial [Bacteroidota bacterium]
SLYEQALSNLTGPGKIVVAAAGNEGSDFIHAGETVANGVLNETVWLVNDEEFAAAVMWYDAGSQSEFSVGAYNVNGTQLEWLGSVGIPAGQLYAEANGDPTPFVVDGVTRGYIRIDARTTADARNGDGTVTFEVIGDNTTDVSETVWSILSNGSAGRVDTWAVTGSEFLANELGFPNQNEIPGDVAMTVGTPSTALGVVAVGSHVTNSSWTDVDGINRMWQNPGPSGPVVPTLGQRSYFSSRGPTRDGRRSPDITAPGELIFSTLSSHLTEGVGVQRGLILQGGSYAGQQGTSMASPHVAGTVALMLQADSQLDPAAVREILQQTARTDGFTGSVPNDDFGSGKIDALAAVLRTLERCGARCEGGGTGGTTLAESEPNNTAAQAQAFIGSFPFTLNGNAEGADVGDISITFTNGSSDDLEDLFRVTTTTAGLTLTLSGFTSDLDLYLLDGAATTLLAQSNTVNPTETIDDSTLPAGEYLVGVSFFDATGSSPYTLQAASGVSVATDDTPDNGELVLHPVTPNPVRRHAAVEFELAEAAEVRLAVYDVLGREVRLVTDGTRRAGPHAASLQVEGLSPGTYVVRLTAGSLARTQRMVVVR